ncbi:MAG: 3'-5' exoribonuclease YhaM family protein, partial [Thermoplasmatota archaeon]
MVSWTGKCDNLKEIFVEDIVEGEEIEESFAVRDKESIRDYTKGYFFKLKIGDKTGDIPLVYWGSSDKDEVQSIYENINIGDVIELKGGVSRYHGELQIFINKDQFHGLTKLDEDSYDVEDYLKRSKKDPDEMFEDLMIYADKIENKHCVELVESFLKDEEFVVSLKKSPYSKNYSHNFVGGLLEHILNDVILSYHVANTYPEIDIDLLLTSAILHDFGKVREYITTTSIELTTESRLIGHTVICERLIKERIDELPGFPKDLAMKISHIILSHHGDYEWGSARSPRMEEAVALHHIDMLDVRLSGFLQAKEDVSEEDEEMIYVSKEG